MGPANAESAFRGRVGILPGTPNLGAREIETDVLLRPIVQIAVQEFLEAC